MSWTNRAAPVTRSASRDGCTARPIRRCSPGDFTAMVVSTSMSNGPPPRSCQYAMERLVSRECTRPSRTARVARFTPRARAARSPRRGCGEAHGGAGVLHGIAPGGVPLVRAQAGLGLGHVDAFEIDVELLGGDQRQGGGDALTDFHLTGANGDAAIGADRDPVVDARMALEARAHSPPPPSARRRTAARTRGCDPQRHRWRERARRTRAAQGVGSARSRPVTATTSPGVQ